MSVDEKVQVAMDRDDTRISLHHPTVSKASPEISKAGGGTGGVLAVSGVGVRGVWWRRRNNQACEL